MKHSSWLWFFIWNTRSCTRNVEKHYTVAKVQYWLRKKSMPVFMLLAGWRKIV